MLNKLKPDYENSIFAEIDHLKFIDIEAIFNTYEGKNQNSETERSLNKLPTVLLQKHNRLKETYDHFMNMLFNGQELALKDPPEGIIYFNFPYMGVQFQFNVLQNHPF